jgi:hypothetical protein
MAVLNRLQLLQKLNTDRLEDFGLKSFFQFFYPIRAPPSKDFSDSIVDFSFSYIITLHL